MFHVNQDTQRMIELVNKDVIQVFTAVVLLEAFFVLELIQRISL